MVTRNDVSISSNSVIANITYYFLLIVMGPIILKEKLKDKTIYFLVYVYKHLKINQKKINRSNISEQTGVSGLNIICNTYSNEAIQDKVYPLSLITWCHLPSLSVIFSCHIFQSFKSAFIGLHWLLLGNCSCQSMHINIPIKTSN